jgi:PKD repeat protein
VLALTRLEDDMKGSIFNGHILGMLCAMLPMFFGAATHDGVLLLIGNTQAIKPLQKRAGIRIGSVRPLGVGLIPLALIISILVSISVVPVDGSVAPPLIEWQKSLGGGQHEEAFSIQQTADFGYIVAGYSESWSGDVPGNYFYNDVWVVKLDSTGVPTWSKNYGGSSSEEAHSIRQTADGGFIVGGYTGSSDHDLANNIGYGSNPWVFKLDNTGTAGHPPAIAWQMPRPTTGTDPFNYGVESIQQTTDGGYILTGDASDSIKGYQYWIAKLTSGGSVSWQKYYGGPEWDRPKSITQTSDGGYIVVGMTLSNSGDVSGNHQCVSGICYAPEDIWVVKLDSNGGLTWQKCLGGTNKDYGSDIHQTPDEGYIVAGYSYSVDGNVTAHVGNEGTPNYWVVKLDRDGNKVWDRSILSGVADLATSIDLTADGGYVVAGISDMGSGNYLDDRGGENIVVVKLDSAGNVVWKKILGGLADDDGYDIQQTTDGGFIVGGFSSSISGDVTENKGETDFWIVKLGPEQIVYPPVPDFYAIPINRGIAPLRVRFIDWTTNNPASWKWDFKNEGVIDSQEHNPTFEYDTPGTYTVSLTACNVQGDCDTETKAGYITVKSPPPVGSLYLNIDEPIGDKHVGDKFTITATTNLEVGEEVLCEVYSSSYDPYGTYVPGTGEFSGATGTVRVEAGSNNINKTRFDVDVSTFKEDTYLVKETAIDQAVGDTSEFDVVLYSPTSTPTPVPTQTLPSSEPGVNVTNLLILPDISIQAGTTKAAPVFIANITDASGIGFVLTYNPAVIYITNLSLNTSLVGATLEYEINNSTVSVNVSLTTPSPITTGIAIGIVNMSVESKGSAGQQCALSTAFAEWTNPEFEASPMSIRQGLVRTVPRGDFNLNNRVDIGDVTRVAYMVVGLTPINLDADFDHSGSVEVGDASKIAWYYIGKIPAL